MLQQQQQALQLSSPPPLPQATSMVTYTPSSNAAAEARGGSGSSSSGSCGKNQGNKRNGTNKQARGAKGAQSVQQPPPPPPPPPPPSSVVHPVKGPLLLPLANQQQALLSQGQHVVFQTEHNGGKKFTGLFKLVFVKLYQCIILMTFFVSMYILPFVTILGLSIILKERKCLLILPKFFVWN